MERDRDDQNIGPTEREEDLLARDPSTEPPYRDDRVKGPRGERSPVREPGREGLHSDPYPAEELAEEDAELDEEGEPKPLPGQRMMGIDEPPSKGMTDPASVHQ